MNSRIDHDLICSSTWIFKDLIRSYKWIEGSYENNLMNSGKRFDGEVLRWKDFILCEEKIHGGFILWSINWLSISGLRLWLVRATKSNQIRIKWNLNLNSRKEYIMAWLLGSLSFSNFSHFIFMFRKQFPSRKVTNLIT